MHYKNIKRIIRKQLKKQYPNWKQLSKKQKKATSKAVLNETVAQYDFDQVTKYTSFTIRFLRSSKFEPLRKAIF